MNESESQTRKQRIDQRLRAANPAWLRSYQKNCILAVEGAIMGGRREFLVAMATGTGKTYCTVAQIYRMLQSGLARRILFLVDRKALAAQAGGAHGCAVRRARVPVRRGAGSVSQKRRSDPQLRVLVCPGLLLQWHTQQRLQPLFAADGEGKNCHWTVGNVIARLMGIRKQRVQVSEVQFDRMTQPDQEQQKILDLLKVKL
jgi:hypothetical protein